MYQVSLEELGLLRISGEQCVEFLQGQLSCDVTEITPTHSRLGTHCDAKGRMLATFRLFYISPHYYLLLPQTMVHLLLKDLSKYAPFYKVTLQEASGAFQKKGLTLDKDEMACPPFKLEKDETVYTDQTTTMLAIPGIIPRVILLSPPTIQDSIPISPKPFSYWETIDIESGIANLTPETRGLFTPHHFNYHQQNGICFTKGCYTGQEVIARMHYLGKLKQQLCKLTFTSDKAFLPSTDIVDKTGKSQGILLTMALSSDEAEQSTYQALAVIQNTAISDSLYLKDVPIQHIKSAAALKE